MGITEDSFARFQDGCYRWKYDVTMVGHKYHGNSVAASLALVGLRYLDEDNARRRHVADEYDRAFDGIGAIGRLPVPDGCVSSRLLYQVRIARRDAVVQFMQERGISTGVHYRDNTEFPMYAYARGTCPRSHQMSAELLSLPMHIQLTAADVARVADALIEHVAD
jgi:dTDP-4-amino-4,6-dideoxygalactose transaminase